MFKIFYSLKQTGIVKTKVKQIQAIQVTPIRVLLT
jgi:hypothetical protein